MKHIYSYTSYMLLNECIISFSYDTAFHYAAYTTILIQINFVDRCEHWS